MFTARQYIEYLIATTGNYACTNLADHLEGDQAVSHDTLSADLRCEKLTPRGLGEVVESPINDSPTADLLLDDSVQDKRYATKIEFVYRQWSGADPGVVGGVGVVNLVHASGPGRAFYSIDYWIYDPEGGRKTKQDHVREMLIRALTAKGIQAHTILVDPWYASVENLKLIHRTGRYFITAAKSNRKVSPSKATGYVNLEDLPWAEDTLRHSMQVKLKELRFLVRLFVIVSSTGDIDWVITNRPEDPQHPTTTADIQQDNVSRWHVEQFHREVKQPVGTKRCHCRKVWSQRNPCASCYLAWLAIKVPAQAVGVSLYQAKERLWGDYLKAQLRQPSVAAVGC